MEEVATASLLWRILLPRLLRSLAFVEVQVADAEAAEVAIAEVAVASAVEEVASASLLWRRSQIPVAVVAEVARFC